MTRTLTAVVDLDGRYDFYGPIHKGLRKAQCELLTRIGSTDFENGPIVAELLTDTREFLGLAAAHLQHEQDHVHGAMLGHAGSCVEQLDLQHDDHRATFADIGLLLEKIDEAEKAVRIALGRRLYLVFSRYVARDLDHMFEEETVAAAQLWSLLSDAELLAMEGRIVGSLPPEKAMAFMRLMIPAANPAERAAMLDGMRQQAPREVFDAVLEFTARPNLSPADFADLADRLGLAA